MIANAVQHYILQGCLAQKPYMPSGELRKYEYIKMGYNIGFKPAPEHSKQAHAYLKPPAPQTQQKRIVDLMGNQFLTPLPVLLPMSNLEINAHVL